MPPRAGSADRKTRCAGGSSLFPWLPWQMFTISLVLKHDPPYQQRYLPNLAACGSSAVLRAAAGRRRQMDVVQGDRFSPSWKEEAAPAPLRLTHKMLTVPAVTKRAYAERPRRPHTQAHTRCCARGCTAHVSDRSSEPFLKSSESLNARDALLGHICRALR